MSGKDYIDDSEFFICSLERYSKNKLLFSKDFHVLTPWDCYISELGKVFHSGFFFKQRRNVFKTFYQNFRNFEQRIGKVLKLQVASENAKKNLNFFEKLTGPPAVEALYLRTGKIL